jgi:hypothetical protein
MMMAGFPVTLTPMKHLLLVVASCSLVLPSCSTEGVQRRQDSITDSYIDLQQRRKIRAQARDERYNAWWDRIMR